MDASDRRKYPRLEQSFRAELSKEGASNSCKGTSVDLSQGGAFIKLNQVEAFKVKDAAIISFSLPPEYTGQKKTIRLKGRAIVIRIDQKTKAVGVEFTRSLKQFEPVELADVV
jgi:c-di-GMP-binding flagellar brake protein YcgR